MMLDDIHTEHGYICRLLKILQQKLTAIRNGQEVNYSLIKDIVDYLQNYAECCHHPKEDVLYRYYQEHYSDRAGEVESLEKEHVELARLTREFADTVDMILMDAVIPLDVFADKLNAFVVRQYAHLELEEKHILPLINQAFTRDDWLAVSQLYDDCECDPLFGGQVTDRYRHLAERLQA